MTRAYRKIDAAEAETYRAADWSTPWPTAQALAERTGRDPSAVLIWAQNQGLAPPPAPRKRVDVEAIRAGVDGGQALSDIARGLGLRYETVRRVARREGITKAPELRPHDWSSHNGRCARCGVDGAWAGARSGCRGVGT